MIETRDKQEVLNKLASSLSKYKDFIINMTPELLSEINAARLEHSGSKYTLSSNISPKEIDDLINKIDRNIPKKMPTRRSNLTDYKAIWKGTYHTRQ